MRRYLRYVLYAKEGVREREFVRALKRYFRSGKIVLTVLRPRVNGRSQVHRSAMRWATPQTYERLFGVRLIPVKRLWKVGGDGVVPHELEKVVDWINVIARFRA